MCKNRSCLSSANMSDAAWGKLVKEKQLFLIAHYEIGVLFVPRVLGALEPLLVQDDLDPQLPPAPPRPPTLHYSSEARVECGGDDVVSEIHLPMPSQQKGLSFGARDKPWAWDLRYSAPDDYGRLSAFDP